MSKVLPFEPEEFWYWKSLFEKGYGRIRQGVTPKQAEEERNEIPPAIRQTYTAQKYLGSVK